MGLRLACAAVCVTGVIILVRFVWVFAATYLPCWLWPAWRERRSRAALAGDIHHRLYRHSWRGVAGGGAVDSLDGGTARRFPNAGLLLLVTFAVILATLVGQGFSFPWVIRKLGLTAMGQREADAAKQREVAARVAGIDAALARLDALEERGASRRRRWSALRRRHERPARLFRRRLPRRRRAATSAMRRPLCNCNSWMPSAAASPSSITGARSTTKPAAASSGNWIWKTPASAMRRKAARRGRC